MGWLLPPHDVGRNQRRAVPPSPCTLCCYFLLSVKYSPRVLCWLDVHFRAKGPGCRELQSEGAGGDETGVRSRRETPGLHASCQLHTQNVATFVTSWSALWGVLPVPWPCSMKGRGACLNHPVFLMPVELPNTVEFGCRILHPPASVSLCCECVQPALPFCLLWL